MPFQKGNRHGMHNNHAKGHKCRNLDQLKNMRWVQRGDESVRIPLGQLNEYLAAGWARGRPKPSTETRRKLAIAQRLRTDRPRDSHTQGQRRNRQYKCRYKRTVEDYEIVFRSQNYHCALCPNSETEKRRLCWDHDHRCCPGYLTCGKCVRGLLCISCNNDMGVLEDILKQSDGSIIPKGGTWLEKAFDYLSIHGYNLFRGVSNGKM